MKGALRPARIAPALLAAAAALVVDLIWRVVVAGPSMGWGLAFGTDAPLWGLSAEGLLHGATPAVPPAWPALVAVPRALGLPLVLAGAMVNHLLAAAIPAVGLIVARVGGASKAGGALVAALLVAWPDRVSGAAELQANGLAALALLAATGLLAQVLRRQARWAAEGHEAGRWGLWAAVGIGLLPLVRENLAVASLAAILGLPLLTRGGLRPALGLLAIWWLSPLLLGELPGATPLQTPWGQRGATALADLSADAPLPGYVAEIPRQARGAYVEMLRHGDRLGLVRWHAARSLALGPDAWVIAALATLVAIWGGRRRPALLALLLPLAVMAPTLVLWSQRRHLVMALPALLALSAARGPSAASTAHAAPPAAIPRARGARLALQGAGLLLLGLALSSWPATWAHQLASARGEARRARTLAELGAWLCQQPEPLLGGPIQDVGLYCPRPRHDPDGSAADAHTLLIVPGRQPPPASGAEWVRVGPQAADLVVYRWQPGQPRPCAEGRPAPGTPYLSAGPVHATLVGCAEPDP